MAKQTINLGAAANDGTGEDLRAGGTKINENFTELYTTKSDTGHNHDGTYAPDDILDSTISGDANNTITVSPKFWSGTQANYDAIGTKDANTIYLIQE